MRVINYTLINDRTMTGAFTHITVYHIIDAPFNKGFETRSLPGCQ